MSDMHNHMLSHLFLIYLSMRSQICHLTHPHAAHETLRENNHGSNLMRNMAPNNFEIS